MEVLSYILILLLILSTIHFVYGGIIAPSIRLCIRNDLFALRDRIRRLIIEDKISSSDKEMAIFVDEGISLFIKKLPSFNISTYLAIKKEISQNKEWAETIENRINSIHNVENKEIYHIFEKTNLTLERAFICNSPIVLFLFPIILLAILFELMIIMEFKKLISQLLMTPTKDAHRFI